MEKLTLTILEERTLFYEALYFLKGLKLANAVQNLDINDYIDQMLYNSRIEIPEEDSDTTHVVVDLVFRDELQVEIVTAFWNAVCAEVREEFPELYEVAFQMYYGVIMALENEKAEGGAF